MIELATIAGSFVSALLLTVVVRRYSISSGLMDTPNRRSSHLVPTPRGGGLAIVVTFLGLLSAMFVMGAMTAANYAALFVPGILIAGIGWIDDHGDVRASLRLLVHAIGAALALYCIGGLKPVQFGGEFVDLGFLGNVLAVVFLAWFTNLYNFMDGIDGIAGSEAIFILLAAYLLGSADAPAGLSALQLGLAAACAGFLVLNWPPAKIFLGDVGSGFLGATIGIVLLMAAVSGALTPWSSLILVGVFLVDATVTLVRRMARGDAWYSAHRTHAYQQAIRRGHRHRTVSLVISAINLLWLLPMAWFANEYPAHGVFIVLAAWIPLIGVAIHLGAGRADR